MSASTLIEPATVRLDADLGNDKTDVIRSLAATLVEAGRATDPDGVIAALTAREEKAATGMKGGFAIPHCKCAAVSRPSLVFARLSSPVDFGAKDGPADLVFMLAAPEGEGKAHLKMLSSLARALVRKDFVASLRQASDDQEVVDLISSVVEPQSAPQSDADATASPAPAAETGSAQTEKAGEHRIRIVAVTSCATGIAHTYMAADSLSQTATEMGIDFAVEPQGSSGTTPLTKEQIAQADAVIFATDVGVRERSRFAGKPYVESGVKRGIDEPEKLLEAARKAAADPHARRVKADSGNEDETSGGGENWARMLQRGVMTGVSYMIPFVAAGGLLMALGFLLGGYDVAFANTKVATEYSLWNLPGQLYVADKELVAAGTSGATALSHTGLGLYLGAVLFTIGNAAMGFMIAVLSGYIAMAIADRPGLAPGFVGGAISVTLGAGFLGALITGLLAGYLVKWMATWKTPAWLRGLMPVVIFPLLGSLVVGLVMFLFLGRPIAAANEGLTNWLGSMSGSSAIVLGIILGLMMCFDLGGPVNKAAYVFATAGLVVDNPATLKIMAAVMAAGMVPPIALSLATFVRKQLFTPAERENGRAAWLLGLSFISEGAIPFAAADPLRVIPSMMLGGATTGALSMAIGVESYAPHGGIFVLFAINPVWGYLVAILAGVAVATAATLIAKSIGGRKDTIASSTPEAAATAAA